MIESWYISVATSMTDAKGHDKIKHTVYIQRKTEECDALMSHS